MSIELAFSKVKATLKMDATEEMADMEITLLEAFAYILLHHKFAKVGYQKVDYIISYLLVYSYTL